MPIADSSHVLHCIYTCMFTLCLRLYSWVELSHNNCWLPWFWSCAAAYINVQPIDRKSPPSSISTTSLLITHLVRPSYRLHPLVRKLGFEHNTVMYETVMNEPVMYEPAWHRIASLARVCRTWCETRILIIADKYFPTLQHCLPPLFYTVVHFSYVTDLVLTKYWITSLTLKGAFSLPVITRLALSSYMICHHDQWVYFILYQKSVAFDWFMFD